MMRKNNGIAGSGFIRGGWVLFLFLLAPLDLKAEVINVRGRWSVKADSVHVFETNQFFDAYVDGEKYYFIVESHAPRFQGYVHAFSDGTDSFYIRYPVTWYEENNRIPVARGTNSSKLIVPAGVYPTIFPTNQIAPVQLLWLALSEKPSYTNVPACSWPLWCLVDYDENYYNTFRLRVKKVGEQTRVMDFIAPGEGTNKNGIHYHYKSPYDKGLLYATYTVNESKAYSGKTLPSEFSFKEYIEKQNEDPASESDVDLFREWNFHIDSVEVAKSFPAEMPIAIPKVKILVNDHRILSEVGEPYGFQIGMKGEQFLSRSSSRFSELSRGVLVQNNARTKAQKLFFPVFILLLIAPVVLIVRKARKGNS